MIKFENVTKTFKTGEAALSEVNLFIEKGDFVFITGPSGSGKTTFFRLLIRDMLPTHGSIVVNDWELTKLPRGKVPHLRRRIGVVFQDLKLLMDRTILENTILPLEMAGVDGKTAKRKVEEILTQVGIESHIYKFPIQLSGGELQRAAIARAMVFSPDILIADEPTGNLDNVTSWEIVKLLQDINKSGTTILMATHNTDIVNSLGKRIVTLEKGRLTRDEKPTPKQEKHHEEHKKHEEHKGHEEHKKQENSKH